ncbi:alpha/beta hydrolase [Emticicia sp. 21SJ11W-3]|uniref:alpha/beta hydrolase n=1 Tax=Emticicia sp. 21SJ11W-3 TaxID=2916755 RepID=UPI00209DC2C7|nr:alpha/beta hydrolase [Emticicia sp. 21SJ11W-3]UTA67603.1 alpha/beta hydrolase [Emticicia sp. 21SJ11W-3]
MKNNHHKRFAAFILAFFFSAFSSVLLAQKNFEVKLDTVRWFDTARKRVIPIAFFTPAVKVKHQKLVIFSHGYGENKGGANLAYNYLTHHLASEGYLVASVQHELPTDSLLPLTGKPQVVRRSNWGRGAANLLFVLSELKKRSPHLDFKHVILVGHSNGGDMTALFAHKYPHLISKIVTLDNRRMELPRTKEPRVYSLRSSDQPADEGVLPTAEEQKKYKITVIKLPATIHNDMDEDATEPQSKEIISYLMTFLAD